MTPTEELTFTDFDFIKNGEDSGTSLVSHEKVAAFISLFGTSAWRKLRKQFATQRIPKEMPGGFTDQEIKEMSDEEWEKNEAAIMEDLKTVPKEEPVFGKITAPDLTVKGFEGQQMFIKHFGYERFFQAMGEPDFDLTPENYRKILGRNDGVYTTRVTWQKGQKATRS